MTTSNFWIKIRLLIKWTWVQNKPLLPSELSILIVLETTCIVLFDVGDLYCIGSLNEGYLRKTQYIYID